MTRFIKHELDEYRRFKDKPEARKPLSSYYHCLCRVLCRQKSLRQDKRDLNSARDIAIMCASLLHAENEADEKSRRIQSFKEFAIMQCLLCPDLKYLVIDVLDLPDYDLPRKKVLQTDIVDQMQNDTPVDNFLDSTRITDCSSQMHMNSTAENEDTSIVNESDDCLYSTRVPLTPPPLGALLKNQDLSVIKPVQLQPVFQDTNYVS